MIGVFYVPNRSNKVALIAHCLLNQNCKVHDLALAKGMFFEVINILHRLNLGVIQLPCPEATFLGMSRWWQVKQQYNTRVFRRHCRSLIIPIIDQVEDGLNNNVNTVGCIGIDGSPTCGVNSCGRFREWSGKPVMGEAGPINYSPGILIEEIIEEVNDRNIKPLKMFGLPLDIVAEEGIGIVTDELDKWLYKIENEIKQQ
jgi:predicted secreted protein